MTTIRNASPTGSSLKDSRTSEKLSDNSAHDAHDPVDDSTDGVSGDDATESVSTAQTVFLTVGLCMAVFCMCLDNTIVSTAIPTITNQFHAISDVGWYVHLFSTACVALADRSDRYGSAYLLTACSFQLLLENCTSLLFEMGLPNCASYLRGWQRDM
jgi:hypothetical protein